MKNGLNIVICNHFVQRLKGFMFTKKIDKILCFPKCNCIHTFFMFNAIDIIMTDEHYNILYTFYNFKPWHIIFPKKNVYYVYELPINTIKVKVGSNIKEELFF